MTVTKTINLTMLEDLEALHYEYNARKEIIEEALSRDIDVTLTSFINYSNEFKEIKKEYESLKDIITNDIVKKEYPNALNWSADFTNKNLIITLS